MGFGTKSINSICCGIGISKAKKFWIILCCMWNAMMSKACNTYSTRSCRHLKILKHWCQEFCLWFIDHFISRSFNLIHVFKNFVLPVWQISCHSSFILLKTNDLFKLRCIMEFPRFTATWRVLRMLLWEILFYKKIWVWNGKLFSFKIFVFFLITIH